MLRAVSIIGYVGMVGGCVALLLTQCLFSLNPLVIVLQLAALWLGGWARITFGRRSFHVVANPTTGGLVTTGPYRLIRHPIYTAVSLFVLAGAAAHASWSAAGWGALVLAGALVRMLCEEKLLVAMYPAYSQYAATNWRMIPYVF